MYCNVKMKVEENQEHCFIIFEMEIKIGKKL